MRVSRQERCIVFKISRLPSYANRLINDESNQDLSNISFPRDNFQSRTIPFYNFTKLSYLSFQIIFHVEYKLIQVDNIDRSIDRSFVLSYVRSFLSITDNCSKINPIFFFTTLMESKLTGYYLNEKFHDNFQSRTITF